MPDQGSRLLNRAWMKWRALAQRNEVEDELDQELRFHFDQVVDRYVQTGMSAGEAKRKARLEYRGVDQVKEDCRDARGVRLLEDLWQDMLYAIRGFRQNPGFTATAALTLAVGIAVNTATFSALYALVFRPLPVRDPAGLRNIYLHADGEGPRSQINGRYFMSYAEFNHLRSNARTADLAGVAEERMSWKNAAGGSVHAQLVTDNLLPMLGARPVLGRLFARDEVSRPGDTAVVVLGNHLWHKYFGADPHVVGKTMLLNRTPFTVIGVADEATQGPLILIPDLWIPYTMAEVARPGDAFIDNPQVGWIEVFARARSGFGDAAMRAELTVLAQQALGKWSPKKTATITVAAASFLNSPDQLQQGAPVMAILFLAVGLVLMVACSNVANMLLARGLARQREVAIRLSIGAGRGRILRQLLVESLLLSLIGGAAGLLLAQVAGRLILAMVPASEVGPHQVSLSPDPSILLYTLAISLATGLIFGLMPAMQTLRVDLTPSLKLEGAELSAGARRSFLRNGLVALQVAVCLLLVVNAMLLLRGLQNALHLDLGQSTRNSLIASFDLRQQQYKAEQAVAFHTSLFDAVSQLPGVKSASTVLLDPFVSQWIAEARLVDAKGDPGRPFLINADEVGADYFTTVKIPLLAGRVFNQGDLRSAAKVVVIDEQLASACFQGRNPIGKRLRIGETPDDDFEIVGVVAKAMNPVLAADAGPMVYQPTSLKSVSDTKLLVRYAGPLAAGKRELEAAVAAIDPNVTVRVKPVEENFKMAVMPVRMGAIFASSLGSLALLLACTGVYSLVSFSVHRRRREMGIRMALGAHPFAVLRMIVWQGMKPVLIGASVGLALGAAAGQLIRAMLYGVSSFDPVSFGSTAALLAAVGILAALLPARAVLRIDPAITLRHE